MHIDDATRERFWSKVRKGPGCWEWTASLTTGYGYFFFRGKHRRAHHVAWMLAGNSDPSKPGHGLFHHCDNPPCVRHDHLFAGATADNVADCAAKGRKSVARGEEQTQAKLTDSAVRQIRRLFRAGIVGATLASRFGVSSSTIYRVVQGRGWRHV